MPCETWTDEMRAYYEGENEPWNFFGTPQLQQFNDRVTQFVPPPRPAATRKSALQNSSKRGE